MLFFNFFFTGHFFGNILNDYKMVAQETLQDINQDSLKATVYISSLFAAGILYKSNPTERDLRSDLLEYSHQISLVGAAIRNKKSDEFIDFLRMAQRQDRLHYTSLGLFSLVWVNDTSEGLDLYDANCKHVRLPWYRWYKKVVDIGILGKFQKTSGLMVDYDINEDEWKS